MDGALHEPADWVALRVGEGECLPQFRPRERAVYREEPRRRDGLGYFPRRYADGPQCGDHGQDGLSLAKRLDLAGWAGDHVLGPVATVATTHRALLRCLPPELDDQLAGFRQGNHLLYLEQQPVANAVRSEPDAPDVQSVQVRKPQDGRGDLPAEPGGVSESPELLRHNEHVIGDRIDTGTQEALQVPPLQDLLSREGRRGHDDKLAWLHLKE
jgi:hypothetical protein